MMSYHVRRPATASAHDLDTLPEGYLSRDIGGGQLRVGVVPRGVRVLAISDDNVVVVGGSLPRTRARGLALAEILPRQRLRRKVVVPFDDFGLARFGDDFVVPNGLRHG